MMDIPLWLTTYRTADGKVEHGVCAGFDLADARKTATRHADGRTVVSVEERETPGWMAVEPLMTEWFESGGQRLYSLRDHILKGGEAICDYRGNTYAARTRMFGKDRPVLNDDGSPLMLDDDLPKVHIGETEFRCKEIRGFTKTILLDPLDEAHVVDRFQGELVEFDAEIRVAPGTWPEAAETPAPH